ncbi:MAG: efflux RND transporter permease subunit [Cloacibacillus evryensis]
MLLSKLERGYRLLLKRAVAHRAATMAVAAGMFVIGMVLVMNTGTQFMADDDESSFMIKCELPSGTEIEESGRVFRELGRAVRRHKAVEYTYANIGTDSGNQSNNGTLYVQLYPKKQRGDINKVMDEVRALTAPFRDVTATFTTFAGKDVEMVLVGGNTATLLDISKKIIAEAEAGGNVRDVETDVRIDKPQLEVEIDRGLADTMDIDVRSMSNELQAYLGGTKAGVYKEDGYRYDIRVMAERAKRSDAADIGKIYFKTGAGDIIQAPGVLSVRKTLAPNVVKRYSRQRSLSISANVTRNFSTGEAAALLTKLADKYTPRDSGVGLVASGQTKTQQESSRLFTRLVVAIILVYVIMAIQFESFIHPFAIMFTLPLLTPGAFRTALALRLQAQHDELYGLILLVGIVVNNGIILIDFIKQERERCATRSGGGQGRADAVARDLITALDADRGDTGGAEAQRGLGIAAADVGRHLRGLFTSTLLTLFVVPVVYLILDDVKERACAWARRLKSNVGRMEEARS